MNYNRAAMKEEVKIAMRQTRPNPMLVTLLYLVIVGVGASLISGIMKPLSSGGGMSLEGILFGIMSFGPEYLDWIMSPQMIGQVLIRVVLASFVVSILTTVWSGLMSAGYAGYCLDMSRGMGPEMGRIFGGFSRAGSVIPAYILVAVFTFLWSMLFGLAFGVVSGILFVLGAALPVLAPLVLLLMLAAYVGFIIAVVWAVLRYAMVPFTVIDGQNPMSAMDAIRASKALMQGRKGSYFVLQLSFIGWQLLEALIVLVGFVIVIVAAAGSIFSFADDFEYILYSIMAGDPDEVIPLLAQMLGPALLVALFVALACGAGIFIIDLWLTPYRTGCNARFYVYATSGQPIQPYGGYPPYGGGPSGPYGGQSGSYGGPSGPYGGQSGSYGGSSGPYGGQSGPYGGQSGSYSGYTRVEQPPQYGTGTYPQWNAPQAPQVPSPFAAEPPAAPAVPQTPVTPPDAAAPASAGDPNDDTPQKPGGPSYPQY